MSDSYELRTWAEQAVNDGRGDEQRPISAATYLALVIMSRNDNGAYGDALLSRFMSMPDRIAELEAVIAEHHPTDIITECHWCGWEMEADE